MPGLDRAREREVICRPLKAEPIDEQRADEGDPERAGDETQRCAWQPERRAEFDHRSDDEEGDEIPERPPVLALPGDGWSKLGLERLQRVAGCCHKMKRCGLAVSRTR